MISNVNFESIIDMIDNAISCNYFPCACFEIGDRNGIIKRHWTGNRSVYPKTEPLDENTLFDMASLTKILSTTMITLKFLEEGKICLSDTLDYFFNAPDDKKEITVQQLLTHTGGIQPFTDISADIYKNPDRIVDIILNIPLAFIPDENIGYSCLGYILLGKILELVGNDNLDNLSQKIVFEPLGMKNTGYLPKADNIAVTDYDKNTGEFSKGIVHDRNARYLGGVAGNAGVFSNIEDMSKFVSMLVNKGIYKEKTFINPIIFEKSIQNYTPDFIQARGLGFKLTDSKQNTMAELFSPGSFGHTGYTGTSIVIDKETGLYTILLTNRVHSDVFNDEILRFRRLFHNRIAAIYAASN